MPVEPLPPIWFPLSPEDDREVRKEVIKLGLALHKANFEAGRTRPGMTDISGREQLALFRSKDADYWIKLGEVFPEGAKELAREFISLLRKFG